MAKRDCYRYRMVYIKLAETTNLKPTKDRYTERRRKNPDKTLKKINKVQEIKRRKMNRREL